MRESPGFDEDNTDSKEVLEDVVLRVTAREYLDTLRAVLTSGGGQPGGEESLDSGGADKVAYIEEDNQMLLSRLENENYDIGQTVTGLGDAVLANPALSHPLTLTIYHATTNVSHGTGIHSHGVQATVASACPSGDRGCHPSTGI